VFTSDFLPNLSSWDKKTVNYPKISAGDIHLLHKVWLQITILKISVSVLADKIAVW